MTSFLEVAAVFSLALLTHQGFGNKEIVIGGLAPVTGPASPWGTSSRKGFDLAFYECNSKGGINGHLVKLIFADDKSDPTVTMDAVNHLIKEDKVVALLGPVQSFIAVAAGRVCQQNNIPMVATTATNPNVTQVGDYIFRACYTDRLQSEVGAKFAFENLKARNVGCIFEKSNGAFKSAAENFAAKFNALGGKVVAEPFDQFGTMDFGPQLAKILPAKPDLLYLPGSLDVPQIIKQARAKGFKGPVLGTDGWDSPKLIELGGDAVEGGYFTNPFSSRTPALKCRISSRNTKPSMEPFRTARPPCPTKRPRCCSTASAGRAPPMVLPCGTP